MTNKTKNAMYSILDLIDSLGTIEFVKLDKDSVNQIRKEVLDFINDDSPRQLSNSVLDKTNSELLGILPTILLDEDKFSTTKDILTFAEYCLMIEIKPYWSKRSKAELIGIVISEVSKQNPKQFNRFLNAWDSFNKKTENEKRQYGKNDFVGVWLNFFNTFKESL